MSVIWAIETSVMRDIAIILVVYGAPVLLATVFGRCKSTGSRRQALVAPAFRHHPIVVWLAALAVFLILLAWGPTGGDRRLLAVAILAATVPGGPAPGSWEGPRCDLARYVSHALIPTG